MREEREVKDIMFTVRLNARQLEILQEQAKVYGTSEAEYIRRLIEKKPLVEVWKIKKVNELRMELHYVSNNLNQVARALNGQYYSSKVGVEKAEAALDKILNIMDAIIEAFKKGVV